ncbi:hypothetical protein [Undibacterium fentianense]|nr:hypothetical protein [Undibacterium fentianense]
MERIFPVVITRFKASEAPDPIAEEWLCSFQIDAGIQELWNS